MILPFDCARHETQNRLTIIIIVVSDCNSYLSADEYISVGSVSGVEEQGDVCRISDLSTCAEKNANYMSCD